MRMLLAVPLVFGAAAPGQEKSAQVSGVTCVWAAHEKELGYRVTVSYEFRGHKRAGLGVFWYQDPDLTQPFKDRNGDFASREGNVMAFKEVDLAKNPRSDEVFLPFTELHLEPGKSYTLWYQAQLYEWSDSGWNVVARGLKYFVKNVRNSDEAAGSVLSGVEVTHNRANDRGVPGFEVRSKIRAEVPDGRLELYVECYDSPRCDFLHVHGNPDRGVASFPVRADPDRSPLVHWIPYDAFDGSKGKRKVFFKVWLIWMREKWGAATYTALDASPMFWFDLDPKWRTLPFEEVLVIPEIRVVLSPADWTPSEDERKQMAGVLEVLNDRLCDVTDGQIRIAKFVVKRMRGAVRHDDPVIRIYRDFAQGDHGPLDEEERRCVRDRLPFGHTAGAGPATPKDIHIDHGYVSGTIYTKKEDAPYAMTLAAAILLHEFMSSWFGLPDEYALSEGKIATTHCPATETERRAWMPCVMGGLRLRDVELCRPGTHDPKAIREKDPGVDCYTRLSRAMAGIGKKIQVPERVIPGPVTAPKTPVEWDLR